MIFGLLIVKRVKIKNVEFDLEGKNNGIGLVTKKRSVFEGKYL